MVTVDDPETKEKPTDDTDEAPLMPKDPPHHKQNQKEA